MRVVLSIRAGKLMPSTILRKLRATLNSPLRRETLLQGCFAKPLRGFTPLRDSPLRGFPALKELSRVRYLRGVPLGWRGRELIVVKIGFIRLYQAFRELGRVVRTMFLQSAFWWEASHQKRDVLQYISDMGLRRQITSCTNKYCRSL